MIPKTVHCIWVGKKPFPKMVRFCMESWKKHLAGYEIKYWNETNIPMEHPYVKEMYHKKKWAFVADYVRFWVLYREGGIYLDTDTELLASLDPFLHHDAFIGKTKDGFIATGVVGAMTGHPFVKKVLDFYEHDTEYSIENTSPRVVTDVCRQEKFDNVYIASYDIFYPCDDGESCTAEKLHNAIAINHWAESWVCCARVRKILRRLRIMSLLKVIFRRGKHGNN